MNNLFAKLFGFLLNIVHIAFLIFLFAWFFQGFGDKVVPHEMVILYGVIAIVSYVIFMGALTTLVSIRGHLADISEKLSKVERQGASLLNERIEPRI